MTPMQWLVLSVAFSIVGTWMARLHVRLRHLERRERVLTRALEKALEKMQETP